MTEFSCIECYCDLQEKDIKWVKTKNGENAYCAECEKKIGDK